MSDYEERNPQRQRRPREERSGGNAPRQSAAPPKRRRRRKRMGAWGALLYVVLVIGASALMAGVGWVAACDVLSLNKPEKSAVVTLANDVFTTKELTDEDGDPYTVYHADMSYVADTLKEQGIIEYPWLFKLFVTVTGKADSLRPGTYSLNSTMDYSALIRSLGAKGAKAEVSVTIQEGFTSRQVFQALADAGVAEVADLEAAAASYDFKFSFLKDVVPLGDKNRLEGYLFPDTYKFYTNMNPVQALNKMILRFDEVFGDEMRDQAAANGQTIAEVVNIASLIEKETTGDDQTHISGVIYNRLKYPNAETVGLLQIDASIIYYTGRLVTNADKTDATNPYNTYVHKGLPPTAICNPGQSALRAALKPDDTKDFYYSLGDDGEHHFFRTYNEHINFINSQKRYNGNGG